MTFLGVGMDIFWNRTNVAREIFISLVLLFVACYFFQAEFICGLLKIVVEKLEHSIPQIIDDDNSFSHFIDELLLFDKDLYMVHNYRSIEHGCLHVLTTGTCLQRWVQLERNCEYCTSHILSPMLKYVQSCRSLMFYLFFSVVLQMPYQTWNQFYPLHQHGHLSIKMSAM